MTKLSAFLLVMLGGSFGSAIRYGLGQVLRHAGTQVGVMRFPIATMGINILGCFCMGLLLGYLLRSGAMQPTETGFAFSASGHMIYLLLAIGILGGWTTFSMFAWDLYGLFVHAAWVSILIYVLGSVILSVIALFVGLWLGRL